MVKPHSLALFAALVCLSCKPTLKSNSTVLGNSYPVDASVSSYFASLTAPKIVTDHLKAYYYLMNHYGPNGGPIPYLTGGRTSAGLDCGSSKIWTLVQQGLIDKQDFANFDTAYLDRQSKYFGSCHGQLLTGDFIVVGLHGCDSELHWATIGKTMPGATWSNTIGTDWAKNVSSIMEQRGDGQFLKRSSNSDGLNEFFSKNNYSYYGCVCTRFKAFDAAWNASSNVSLNTSDGASQDDTDSDVLPTEIFAFEPPSNPGMPLVGLDPPLTDDLAMDTSALPDLSPN